MVGIFSLADFFVSRQALMAALTLSNVTATLVNPGWSRLMGVILVLDIISLWLFDTWLITAGTLSGKN
jgi:hypothetical protein